MIKKDIITKVAEQTNMLRSEVEAVIAATLDVIADSLVDGESVVFRNFGTFRVEKSRAQKGFDFKRKKPMDIIEKYRPKLQFSKKLSYMINLSNMGRENQ